MAEIGHKMAAIWAAASPGAAITAVLGEKLREIDVRIAALGQLREQLAARLALDCPLMQQADEAAQVA